LFVAVAACFAVVLSLLARLVRAQAETRLPGEPWSLAILTGLRYVRHCVPLRDALLRCLLFVAPASALWALLPLVARDGLGLGANGYGLLFGCLGIGGVVGASILPLWQRRASIDGVINSGNLVFALVTAAAALMHQTAALGALLFVGGFAWMTGNSTLVAVVQTSSAGWVRARVASVYLLVMMGSMAFGSAVWGVVADHLGTATALALAGLATALGALVRRSRPLALGTDAEFASAESAMAVQLDSSLADVAKPIAVQIAYRVTAERAPEFRQTLAQVGVSRRRNGARSWRMERHDGCGFVERYEVASGLEYRRHVERTTRGQRRAEDGRDRSAARATS
jgi:hypothetical protein